MEKIVSSKNLNNKERKRSDNKFDIANKKYEPLLQTKDEEV
ncbi:MAG: hypothetical protein QXW01_00075 [Candidatus Aenigmatarchaeota archaeon]